jgi:hypothetical protein
MPNKTGAFKGEDWLSAKGDAVEPICRNKMRWVGGYCFRLGLLC